MEQLILHLFGDYVTQSDWMATEKTKRNWPAFCHAWLYSVPFLLLGPSSLAYCVIFVTHFLIDRFRLARYAVWAKNWLAPRWVVARKTYRTEHVELSEPIIARNLPWSDCRATGYPHDKPAWLAVWLLIAADNTLHLAINYSALRWL